MPLRSPGSIAVAALLLVGCNAITGADGLTIEDDEESADSTDGTGSKHPGATGAGAGSTTGQGGQGSTTTGTTSSSSSGSSSSGSSSSSSSSSSGGAPCVAPGGPTGVAVGQVLSQSLTWQGFAPNSAQAGTVSIGDFYDCDGSKGVNALLLITSATWCGACQEEASVLEQKTGGAWQGMGIRVVTLMIEDGSGDPATVATAQAWKDAFGLVTSAVVADPDISMASSPSFGTPLEVVVDPRTMQVVERQEGYSYDYPTLTQLAQQNSN